MGISYVADETWVSALDNWLIKHEMAEGSIVEVDAKSADDLTKLAVKDAIKIADAIWHVPTLRKCRAADKRPDVLEVLEKHLQELLNPTQDTGGSTSEAA